MVYFISQSLIPNAQKMALFFNQFVNIGPLTLTDYIFNLWNALD